MQLAIILDSGTVITCVDTDNDSLGDIDRFDLSRPLDRVYLADAIQATVNRIHRIRNNQADVAAIEAKIHR